MRPPLPRATALGQSTRPARLCTQAATMVVGTITASEVACASCWAKPKMVTRAGT